MSHYDTPSLLHIFGAGPRPRRSALPSVIIGGEGLLKCVAQSCLTPNCSRTLPRASYI
jgi:hypothetical protein